jgi:exonuclease III
VRIVTWNMDYWLRSAEQRAAAWDYLRSRIRPDVALVQEAVPPELPGQVVFRAGGLLDDRRGAPRDLGWGSAVVAFGLDLRSIEQATNPFTTQSSPLLRTFPGSVAIAEIDGADPLVVISVYGLIERGYADTTVHRILSDLQPLIDERRGRRIMLAGDLNITTQWSVKHRGSLHGMHEVCLARDRNVFDRFAALGLHNIVERDAPGPLDGCDCSAGEACRHVRTQRHRNSSFPWQNDYVFVSADLLARSPTVEVLDEEAAWNLSGHCPVVIDLPSA